ncbi:MAG: toxin-antitoxin system, antitoxin component, Xre family protein [Planctomycetes bacterium]|nr:toxin-antitoxin system, antitoxin component, Xre family protein [Planctomycetota bacterium]
MAGRREREMEILEKIKNLPPEKVSTVEDFIDFLRSRGGEFGLLAAAARLSEQAFREVWENPLDAEYDEL